MFAVGAGWEVHWELLKSHEMENVYAPKYMTAHFKPYFFADKFQILQYFQQLKTLTKRLLIKCNIMIKYMLVTKGKSMVSHMQKNRYVKD